MPHSMLLRLVLTGLCAVLCLPMAAQTAPAAADAAPQGITVVSDTSDAPAPDTVAAAPSGPSATPIDENDAWGSFAFSFLRDIGLTGWLFLLPVLLVFAAPLLLLVLLAWWLLWGRHRPRRGQAVAPPQPAVRRNRVVRNAALGAGLVLMCAVMNWRLGAAIGLLVLCVAAGDGLIWWLDHRRP